MLQVDPKHRRSTLMEHRIFVAAVAVGLVHAVDDAVVNRQPGVEITQHLVALAVVGIGALLAVWVFPRVRPGLRSALALTAGVLVGANAALHLLHIAVANLQGSDLTGAFAAVAALVLVALAGYIPFRHRGERPVRVVHRWARRVFVVVIGLLVAQFVLVPVVIGMVQTHKFREHVGDPPNPDFRAVSFRSSDGLRLSGWYLPSRNGAAVVVVSSAGGDRTGSKRHARLLGRSGYGVLTYDARGSGESEGTPNGWGWGWEDDVDGAIDFLQDQPDVTVDVVGGLGLSTGADVLLEVAAHNRDLGAVVADGATARSFADKPPGALDAPLMWTMFASGRLFSGESPGEPLTEVVSAAAPTPILLVASGSLPGELFLNDRYAAAGPSTTLWRLPDVSHTNAINQRREEYQRRVIAHFDGALLDTDRRRRP
jgi:hypothetical protein